MQKTAPYIDTILPGSSPPMDPGACPSAEELAAYIDGNLGKAESRRVTEHLASCENCYTIYMGVLQFQLDSSPAEPEGVVDGELKRFPSLEERERAAAGRRLSPPAKRGKVAVAAVRRWLPIAALLLVGVGTGTYFQLLASPPGLVTTRLTPFPPSPEQLWLGPTYRGEGGDEEAKLDEAAFRMGVQLVNLQASLKSGNVLVAQAVVARILGLLKAQSFTDDLQKGYTGITIALENHNLAPGESGRDLSLQHDRLGVKRQDGAVITLNGEDQATRENLQPVKELQETRTAKVLPEAYRLAKESREAFETTPLDLGQWVEAGRLSALAQDPSFFQQPDTQSFLRRFRWREKLGMGDTKLDPVSRESLDQISKVASKSDLQAPDYVKLKEQFDKILGIYYPDT
jgi:hypothetical protein